MKYTRDKMQKLAQLRLREARALYRAELFRGAYYFSGLCIECALKACIAKKTKRYDFPDKKIADNSWSHDLSKLLKTAELDNQLNEDCREDQDFRDYWSIVQAWNVDCRYNLQKSKKDATGIYQAIVNRRSGVFQWIKKYW